MGTFLRDHTTAGRHLHTGLREHMSVKHEKPTTVVQQWRPTRDLYDGHKEATTATTRIYQDHSSHSRPTMMAMDNPSQSPQGTQEPVQTCRDLYDGHREPTVAGNPPRQP